jgi:hypothetical protein
LPQGVYYAATSLAVFRRYRERASFIVPSGNLGNAVACLWARRMGLPIGDVVLAHNANRAVPDYLESGEWQPRASLATLASAMDVGNPSNLERLQALFPQFSELQAAVRACSVSDAQIRARIRIGYEQYGQVWCPHTATAAEAWERLPQALRATRRWVLVATAHPAKFPEIVEPLIGRPVAVPPSLAALYARRSESVEVDANLNALRALLEKEVELTKLTPTAWALIGLAAALGFALSWAIRWYRHYRARKALRAAVTGGTSEHLIDTLVPDGMGAGFHVDYLLLTARGVVVIDLRDVRGNIFDGDQIAEWTVMDGAQRFTFTNPQGALYDRIAAVKAIAV